MSEPATGSKIRPLARLLDASGVAFWVADAADQLVYVSAATGRWLGVDPQDLIRRRSRSGLPAGDETIDRAAAVLSPPPSLKHCKVATHRIHAPNSDRIHTAQFCLIEDAASLVRSPDGREANHGWMGMLVGTGHAKTDLGDGQAVPAEPEMPGEFDAEALRWHDADRLRQSVDRFREFSASRTRILSAGDSAGARRLRREITLAAAVPQDVLIVCPRGGGFRWIAQHLHDGAQHLHDGAQQHSNSLASPSLQPAAGVPAVSSASRWCQSVDGALMDRELLEATLGDTIARLRESPDRGASLLIDQIERMPVDAQAYLEHLRAGLDGQLRLIASHSPPIGRNQQANSIAENRVVAQPTIACEALRERFEVLQVNVPRLAERVADVPVLASALLDLRMVADSAASPRWHQEAIDALLLYPWPGEFDELEAVVRHAIAFVAGGTETTKHVLTKRALPLAVRTYRPPKLDEAPEPLPDLDDALAETEHRLIMTALRRAGGNRADAARQLGISRGRLLRRLQALAEVQRQDGPDSIEPERRKPDLIKPDLIHAEPRKPESVVQEPAPPEADVAVSPEPAEQESEHWEIDFVPIDDADGPINETEARRGFEDIDDGDDSA